MNADGLFILHKKEIVSQSVSEHTAVYSTLCRTLNMQEASQLQGYYIPCIYVYKYGQDYSARDKTFDQCLKKNMYKHGYPKSRKVSLYNSFHTCGHKEHFHSKLKGAKNNKSMLGVTLPY